MRRIVEGHHAASAQHVVDLVLALLVIADAGARLQHALAKREMQIRRVAEKHMADRLTRTLMRARFGLRDLGVALNDEAAFLLPLLRGHCRRQNQREAERERAFHRDAPWMSWARTFFT